ncbi:3-oxoacyl-ACP synthase [Arcticibacter sp. MXS-1]|uniref:3-oxoacyl-ACP synthase n=1 Tax=Arcticibacter sp. MXS-1 TaxID=3341726 RepID=UPI0035A875F9
MTLKEKLYRLCIAEAEARIAAAELNIRSAKDAQSNETKSSAGDKYETSREMMEQEISFNQTRLMEARKLKHGLSLVNPSKQTATVQPGSLVFTSRGNFYIATAIGLMILDTYTFQVISPSSPLARAFAGKTEGDMVSMNGQEYRITKLM